MPPLPVLQDDRRPERRRKVREMAAVLDSDLYRRTGSGEASAIWTSPLKWIVEYGYDEAAEGYQAIWCEVRGPDGKVLARTEDADALWLDASIP